MKNVNLDKLYDKMVDKMNKYNDEATRNLSSFYVTENELFVALYIHTKGDTKEIKKILKHEYAHYDEAIKRGYKPKYCLNFYREPNGKVFFYPGVDSESFVPKRITVPEHFKSQMAILTAPDEPSPIDMKSYKEYESQLKEAEKRFKRTKLLILRAIIG